MAIGNKYPLYAKVLVDIHSPKLNKPFVYGVTQEQLEQVIIGSAVRVPFNRRTILGYVVDLTQFPPPLPPRVKEIKAISEVTAPQSLWDKEMIDLARWMERYYACTFLDALKVMIPAPVRVKEDGSIPEEYRIKMVVLKDNKWVDWDNLERKSPSQARALKILQGQKGAIPLAEAVRISGATYTVFRSLEKKGLIEIFEGSPSFRYFHCHPVKSTMPHMLTGDQQKVMDILLEKLASSSAEIALLYGITGSGKTEIYLQIIQRVLNEGKEALALIPEISLTPQTIARFRERFGEEIAVLHSRLTSAERRQMWWKIRRKEVRVALGARSAIFAPMENIGVIVIDEEHDESYKQENEPRYHARQVAIKRAMNHNALVILGSATPSLESFYWASCGKYTLLTLPKRIGESVLPQIEIIDLKKDFSRKKTGLLGDTLKNEMKSVLESGEQVILFLNRRGYSAFLLCTECGNVIRCPDCDITLTYHKVGHILKCHYCDYRRPAPTLCPFCQGFNLITPSLGIQKVEEELNQFFPGTPYIRMDRDTTGDRDAHHRLITQFADQRAKILIGTQMIAKGHDFPGVTLVGVILADVSLYLPDFRSLERTFQLLTQVAGRAGRRESQGKVIIQTYNPKTPVIQAVARQDYLQFYQWEVENRRPLNYPPFSHIINLLFTGEVENKVREYSILFGDILKSKKFRELFYSVLGPAPCPISRIKSKYRWHIAIKVKNVVKSVALIRTILERFPSPTGISFHVDVDPVNLM